MARETEVHWDIEDSFLHLLRLLNFHELSLEVEAAALRQTEVEQDFSVHFEEIRFEGELKFSSVHRGDGDCAVVVQLPRVAESVEHRRQSFDRLVAFRGHEESRHSLHEPLERIAVDGRALRGVLLRAQQQVIEHRRLAEAVIVASFHRDLVLVGVGEQHRRHWL